MKTMRLSFLLFCVLSTLLAGHNRVVGQSKPWTGWDKKAVERMLNNSAWGQTQTETDTSEMTVSFGMSRQGDAAANNQALSLNYRIRFFSARPIREAFARSVMLNNPSIKAEQLENFVNGDYSESIVVAVTYDVQDRRFLGQLNNAFSGATTASLAKRSYLERNDGKRIELAEYAAPSSDGTGAKFVFPRMVDGKPFVAETDEFVRFITEIGRDIRISWRFKIDDMKYNGKLEY